MSQDGDGRMSEILERAAAFYERFLWESEVAGAVRRFLIERHGVSEETLREFQVGYAPFGWFALQEHMARWQYSPRELQEAGVIQESRQSDRHYDYFRSRIIFPVRDARRTPSGFAGLALHYGPSWPKWLTSPESLRYRRRSAMFGFDRAATAMRQTGRAVVLNDCLEVLQHHEQGQHEAVAVIRSNVTRDHIKQVAALTGTTSSIVVPGSARLTLGAALRSHRGRSAPAEPSDGPAADLLRDGADAQAATTERRRIAPHRTAAALGLILLMVALSLALWIAVPVGWLWIGSQLTDRPEPNATVYFVIGTGILLSMLGGGYLLVRLNRAYMRLTAVGGGTRVHVAWLKSVRSGGEEYGRGVLDVIMVGSALTAVIAMAVWFFLFARVPG
jgi:hypothetical protein